MKDQPFGPEDDQEGQQQSSKDNDHADQLKRWLIAAGDWW